MAPATSANVPALLFVILPLAASIETSTSMVAGAVVPPFPGVSAKAPASDPFTASELAKSYLSVNLPISGVRSRPPASPRTSAPAQVNPPERTLPAGRDAPPATRNDPRAPDPVTPEPSKRTSRACPPRLVHSVAGKLPPELYPPPILVLAPLSRCVVMPSAKTTACVAAKPVGPSPARNALPLNVLLAAVVPATRAA